MDSSNTQIAIFRQKETRKTIHNNEWWFVVVDVIAALTDSKDPKQYIKKMRSRDSELNKGWVQFVPPLLISTAGSQRRSGISNSHCRD